MVPFTSVDSPAQVALFQREPVHFSISTSPAVACHFEAVSVCPPRPGFAIFPAEKKLYVRGANAALFASLLTPQRSTASPTTVAVGVAVGLALGLAVGVGSSAVADGAVAHRRLTSRLGHVVELADGTEPSTQHIRLALAGNAISLRLGKDRADLTLPSGVPLKIVSGESSIELDGNGAITLSGTTIALKGQQSVTIEGMEVTAKATTKFAASGAQVEVKGEATATLQASGVTAVKGAMVQIN